MPSLDRVKTRVKNSLYCFEGPRRKYRLCPASRGFFQPFTSFAGVQQQIKTTLISPFIGLFSIVENSLQLIKAVLIMVMSIPCMSPDLFIEGLADSLGALVSMIVCPLVATGVTLASLVSILTRTFATAFSYEGDEFNTELLSFLPDNPYSSYR